MIKVKVILYRHDYPSLIIYKNFGLIKLRTKTLQARSTYWEWWIRASLWRGAAARQETHCPENRQKEKGYA